MAETTELRQMDRGSSPSAKRQRLHGVGVTSGRATEVRHIVWHIDNFQMARKNRKLLATHAFNITAGVSIGFPCTWKMSLNCVEGADTSSTAVQMQPKPRGIGIRINQKLIGIPEFADRVYSQCFVKLKTATMADFVPIESLLGFNSQCYKDTIELNLLSKAYNEIMEKLVQDDALTLQLRLTLHNFKNSPAILKPVDSKKTWMEVIARRILDSTATVRNYVKTHKVILFPSDQSSKTSEGIPEEIDSVMMEMQSGASSQQTSSNSDSSLEAPSDESMFDIDELPAPMPEDDKEEDKVEDLFTKVQRWLQGSSGEQLCHDDY